MDDEDEEENNAALNQTRQRPPTADELRLENERLRRAFKASAKQSARREAEREPPPCLSPLFPLLLIQLHTHTRARARAHCGILSQQWRQSCDGCKERYGACSQRGFISHWIAPPCDPPANHCGRHHEAQEKSFSKRNSPMSCERVLTVVYTDQTRGCNSCVLCLLCA